MNIFVLLTVSSMLAELISSETTKGPITTQKGPRVSVSNIDGSNPLLDSLWIYKPTIQGQDSQMLEGMKIVATKQPQSLTRLAKTLSLGFDPYFSKGYFEPFERRQKPVTLVAFRKHGLVPRTKAKTSEAKSTEIAELQSPFNDISNFWVDD